MDQKGALPFPAGFLQVGGNRLFGLRILERHIVIKEGNLCVLVIYHRLDGIPQAKTSDQQGCTAANTQYHHDQAAAVTQHIADGYLMKEAQPPPQGGNVLQEHPLSCLGGLGADQFCRRFGQFHPAGEIGCTHGAKERRRKGNQGQCGIKDESQGSKAIDNAVDLPDNPGQPVRTGSITRHTADQCGRSRIEEVLGHDLAVTVSKGFQNADLGALFIHHAGHGGHTHQSRHQEEEHRKHYGNSRHNRGIIIEANITGVFFPG